MFEHNINPVMASFGILEFRYYGLVYVIAFILVFFYLKHLIRIKKLNLKIVELQDLLVYLMIGVLVGGRFFYCFVYNPSYYFFNIIEFFYIWQGGMSFHGALLGSIGMMALFAKKKGVGVYKLLDNIVVPASIMLFFGRIANFINGELYGHISNVPWAVKFKGVVGYRHPSQLYEALKNLGIFSFLFWLSHKKYKEGLLFWSFVFLYGSLRFLIEFFRFSPNYYLGLSLGQYLCLMMIFPSVYMLVKKYIKL